MTVKFTETLASSQNDLLHRLADILANHPEGSSFRLMYVPQALRTAEDEVLVQVVNGESGVIELHPRKLDALRLDEVVHATQVLDPSDHELNEYASSPVAAKCLKRYGLDKKPIHVYD
ncbi:hypothetical protein [Rhodococcus ruber]|uniref:hypothetical protein n=1 Tax=Rhodococcus ruber TaxID=1830 RepID=UPI000F54BC37|nr:hypothetical protein [Rhodococcus ruber]